MTALDLDIEKAMHYHNEGYKSDNDHWLPTQVARPIHVYSFFTIKATFNSTEFTTSQHPISPFTLRHPRSLLL